MCIIGAAFPTCVHQQLMHMKYGNNINSAINPTTINCKRQKQDGNSTLGVAMFT